VLGNGERLSNTATSGSPVRHPKFYEHWNLHTRWQFSKTVVE
jgi:hypothetical protein